MWFKRKESSPVPGYREIGKYEVIDARKIRVPNTAYLESDRLPEEKYVELLTRMQHEFAIYEQTGEISSNLMRNLFIDIANCVAVTKISDDTYTISFNGRHRAYFAAKHNLKLLVYVDYELIK